MVRLDDRGVADILAIAFMFVILVLAAVFMHTYSLRPLRAATDRQLELKSEHLYMTLELAWVEPYSVSFLRAATENILLEQPTVPGSHLRSAIENTLEYLCPPTTRGSGYSFSGSVKPLILKRWFSNLSS